MEKLFQSVKNGDTDAFDRYASKMKQFINTPDNFGFFLIHYAAQAGYYDICQKLIELKASINIFNHQRKTPLHLAVENQYTDICNLFLNEGAIVDAKILF